MGRFLESPAPMPVRATKRGAERTPLHGDCDVLICGASFAGLAVARELRRHAARACSCSTATRSASARRARAPRRPSGCATSGLEDVDPPDLRRARHPHARAETFRWTLPWTFSTFDYRELCALLRAQAPDAQFDTAKVDGARRGSTPCTPTAAT